MPQDSLKPGWTGSPGWIGLPPHAQPFVHGLNRMQARETIRPEQLQDRAVALLEAHFGPGAAPATAFSRGGTGLISEHTHYFDGFAVMLPLAQGTAVALRAAASGPSYVAFESGGVLTFEESQAAPIPALRVVAEVLNRIGSGTPLEVSVVSSIAPAFQDARLSSLGVALTLAAAPDLERHARLEVLAESLEAALYPFSLAYPIAALDGKPDTYTLVDTRTYEQAALDALPSDLAAWGLVDPGAERVSVGRSRVLERRAQRALAHLQERGFEKLHSFRYLEHQDLPAALAAADASHRPTIHYLVTENRRVVNFVRAIRQRDAQMMGTILLTSFHARREWEGTRHEEERAVDIIETMLLEGMFGASLTGHGRSVLVLGQPASLPLALDRIAGAVSEQAAHPVETMIL